MADSIAATLGIGSGIDTKALVSQLVSAQFDFKTQQLTAKADKLTAQISGIAQLKSGLISFSNALAALSATGSLATSPTSSDTGALTVSALSGAKLGSLTSEIEVRQLATSQMLTSAAYASASQPVGKGTLTITLGTASYSGNTQSGFVPKAGATPVTVTIGDGDNSLAGLARAINAANAGVTATVVADADGATLSIRGATGAEQAFRIDVAEDGGAPGLNAFAFNPGNGAMTLARASQDSILVRDGVTVRRPGNSISDLIPGVKIDLNRAEIGHVVTIGATRPTAAVSQAVNDFVAAYNELRSILKSEGDPKTGTLGGDPGVRAMAQQLSTLTSTRLVQGAAGAPTTLAEIGVKTNRDGTISVDAARLDAVLASNPDAVEAMFNPQQGSDNPLISITSAAGKTPAGTYAVSNLLIALPAIATGAARPAAFATPLTLDASNNRFSLSVDGGAAVELTLPEGSYADGNSLAAALTAAAQADPATAGRATFAWVNDRLVATSARKGATSAVALNALDGTLDDALGLTGATMSAGRNASGTIAGKPVFAVGDLIYASVTSPASGLVIRATGDIISANITIDLGLTGALASLAKRLTAKDDGLTASEQRYNRLQAEIAKDQEKIDADAEKLRDRLTLQFASMDARVSAYKATQSFLEQQVKMWSADR